MTGPSPPNLDVNGRRPDIDSTLLSPVFENSHRYASRNSRDVPLTRPSISDDALSDGEVSPVSPRLPSFSIPRPSHKPRAELQKLLAHSLEQLRRRPKPPSVFDQFKQGSANADDIGTGSVAETLRGAVKFKSARANGEGRATGQDESDDEDDGAVFSTNRTCELLSQMQEVLAVATEVFDSERIGANDGVRNSLNRISPFRLRRFSAQNTRNRSRSPSPNPNTAVQSSDLTLEILDVLSSIISEDCRYQISSPRPFRPPNALQAMSLEVARYMTRVNARSPEILAQICYAVLPAFSTFRKQMWPRLLLFFEELLRLMLDILENERWVEKSTSALEKSELDDQEEDNDPAPVAITVQEADDDTENPFLVHNTLSWAPWTPTGKENPTLVSATSPLQSLSVYHISSVVSNVLATALEHLEFTSPDDHTTAQSFYSLFETMMQAKVDIYLDLLSVVAYHSEKARFGSLSLLSRYWPKSLGHTFVSRPLSVHANANPPYHTLHGHTHQFLPWRFPPQTSPSPSECLTPLHCLVWKCRRPIEGFGLFCPFCFCAVHLDCYDYPDGYSEAHYRSTTDGTGKLVIQRFCDVVPARNDKAIDQIHVDHHHFRLTSLFSLTLCFHCREPLWGCAAQAYRCVTCNHFAHRSCLTEIMFRGISLPRCRSQPLDASHITIEYDVLRHSFVRSHKGLLLTKADLEQRTFEEISVLHAVLWLEMHILDHGTAQSSVAVCRHGTRLDKLDEFELHYCVRLYEAYLGTSRLQISSAVTDYMEENGVNTTDFSMYFDWPLITYITTVIKTPFDRAHLPGGTPPGLLSVNPDQLMDEVESDSSSQPAEMTNLAHLRDALGHVIGLQSEAAARHFLDHLHNLGLITRTDGNPLLFDEDARPFEVQCSFPLPLGLDLSSEVETLFGAVEACLSDLDISMNEAGFLLLLRRLWPNGMATDYALRRLARAVVAWVVAEETRVARIIKEYVSMTATVPGMRSGPVSQQIWPAWSELRVLTTGARPSGNDYSKYRLELRRKYAIPWMLALYNKDPAVYCHTIRELCDELAEESMGVLPSTVRDREHRASLVATRTDLSLRHVIKMTQSGLLFNPLEDVLSDWLHSRPEAALAGDQQPIASLSRLVNRETEISHRRSMTMMLSGDTLLLASFNPWELLKKTALQDADGFLRSVAWLHLFARSGVDIPSGTFLDIVDIGGQHLGLTMTYAMSLVQSALLSAWMKSRGRPELQKLVSVLHTRFYDEISGALRAGPIPSELISFIKHSVAVCLLVYGCERNNVKTRGLVREEEIKHLPSRRNVGNRVSTIAEAIDVDSEFIDALKRYADFGIDEITCIVAQFLDVVLCDTKVAEEVRVGDFVSVESPVLCQCMWKFYAVQHHEISAIRMRLLLRILVADPAPFHLMLQDIYGSGSPWELRIQASTRLFKIIMDLPNPAFSLEDRKWRSSISDIFYYFFSAIWSDEAEEIRTAVDSWSQSLLPAHFEAISRCWDETMEDAPVEERIRLTSFLIQLRSHFPRWQVLSWDVVARCLPGDMDGMENSENNAGVSSDLEDRDSTVCSVSTVVLALGMVANLVPVDINVLKRIKNCLAAVLGFRKPPPVYGELQVIPASSYPCIGELVKVLDAFYPFDVTPSDMGRSGVDEESPSKLLAGSIFIDLVLAIFLELRDLDSLPLTVIKQLLECLLIIIYKHDFDSKSLINLRSVLNRAAKRVLGLVVSDTSYQIRQLALTVCTEFIKRFPLPRYYGLICDMIETAAQVMTSLSLSNDDILAAHARSFLEKALSSFASSGLFSILCERPLDQAFFQVIHNITESHSKSAGVLGGSLRDMLLLDTLRQAQAPERDVHRVQTIMNNLNTFVEVVHHSDYTEDHMRFIASALHAIARRASEGNAQMFNPNSTINMAATLIQYNKVHSRVLLQAVDTVLRAVSLRCNLDTASLRHILQVTDTLYRKANRTNPPTGQNQVAQTILELLSDGLRNKARVNSSSLSSMMEAISDYADMLPTAISSLRADCFFYLASYTSPALHSPADFDTSTSVANWLLKSAEYNPDGLTRMLSENSAERHTSPLSLRAWNILVLAALNSASDDSPALLLGHFTNFSAAYHVALRPFVQFSSTGSKRELTPADINHAYAGIRLWILLARRVFNKRGLVGALPSIFQGVGEDGVAKMIWNELWPPFCTVIASFDEDAEDGMISPATTSAWSTVAELFLFLHQIRSVLALDSSAQATLLNRLRSLGRGEVANNKLGRALSSISEPPPEITLDVAIGQIGRDVAAVEKLHAAESQRKEPAKPQERRKDVRIAS